MDVSFRFLAVVVTASVLGGGGLGFVLGSVWRACRC
jgi:hypothetical protein